jgi:hypothetical protein
MRFAQTLSALPHPLPASPIKGEVPSRGLDCIEPQEWSETSPLMGEVGGGGRKHQRLSKVSLATTHKSVLMCLHE